MLLNHKYDYCVFNVTVMDDIEEFNIHSEIIEGLYYSETDKYFPLRGNGWYYHPLTSYCLEKGITNKSKNMYHGYERISLNGYHRGYQRISFNDM